MDKATLGDVPGAGEVRIRRRSESAREFRGVFAFRREHEATLVELLAARMELEYEGLIDGERQRLIVRLTDLSLETGLAYFQGLGEPFGDAREASAG